jgi:RNA polymerase sigma factor (sigma-70 family)
MSEQRPAPAARTKDVNIPTVAGPVRADNQSQDLTLLFREHQAELVHLGLLLTGSQATAEDVVQDVFARLCTRDRLDPGVRPLPYLRTSVVNGCRSWLRRQAVARRVGATRAAQDTAQGSAEDEAIVAEDRRQVLAALAGLPRRRREVLVLRYWLGLTESEISAVLGISTGTVRSTAKRGLAALASKLGEQA